jgi:hypothetical protein
VCAQVLTETLEQHSNVCVRLDRAVNGDHGLSERLSAFAACLSEGSIDRRPDNNIDRLRRVCEETASLHADAAPSTVSRCEVGDLVQAISALPSEARRIQGMFCMALGQTRL